MLENQSRTVPDNVQKSEAEIKVSGDASSGLWDGLAGTLSEHKAILLASAGIVAAGALAKFGAPLLETGAEAAETGLLKTLAPAVEDLSAAAKPIVRQTETLAETDGVPGLSPELAVKTQTADQVQAFNEHFDDLLEHMDRMIPGALQNESFLSGATINELSRSRLNTLQDLAPKDRLAAALADSGATAGATLWRLGVPISRRAEILGMTKMGDTSVDALLASGKKFKLDGKDSL